MPIFARFGADFFTVYADFSRFIRDINAQRALRDILMPRGKNCLPTVSRQFLTLTYPRPNCLLKCPPKCLSPTIEDIFSSFKIAPVVRVIVRQLSGKNCLAAIFASRHQDASPGPLGGERKKPLVIDDFFTVSFSRFAPSRCMKKESGEPQKLSQIAPPSVPPTEALFSRSCRNYYGELHAWG